MKLIGSSPKIRSIKSEQSTISPKTLADAFYDEPRDVLRGIEQA